MGIESPVHLLFIAIVALIVLGPRRLPDLARALGQGIREFRGSLEEGANAPQPFEQPRPAPTQALAEPIATPDPHQPPTAGPAPASQTAPVAPGASHPPPGAASSDPPAAASPAPAPEH